jgi:hypothetical protein
MVFIHGSVKIQVLALVRKRLVRAHQHRLPG